MYNRLRQVTLIYFIEVCFSLSMITHVILLRMYQLQTFYSSVWIKIIHLEM